VLLPGELDEIFGSSTKPEVDNISHYRQRNTELRQQITRTENLVTFGRVVFEIMRADKQTDKTGRHTNTLITILRKLTGRKVITSPDEMERQTDGQNKGNVVCK